ncbi:unnamed protein product [Phytophthora fragariaefolia]|uniref:Unnamed protein product n=1 Tax=Phytophthora fragariaefolia TaxID=1490495 RepID=A0A9W6UAH1_9STRA|nr:unnamed protein product [Phytophthora fragariaefolia]
MTKWLSFLAEYNFQVEYKPGRLNVVGDVLSRRPDYAVHKTEANAISVLLDYFAASSDKSRQNVAKHIRTRVHGYPVHNDLLLYSAVDDNADRDVVPDDHELNSRLLTIITKPRRLGREKKYLLITRDFYWSDQYKWVRKYVRGCEVYQHVKPALFSQAPLQSLPTPSECWQSISMYFVFGLPPDTKQRTGIVAFFDRFSKMVHLATVPAEVAAKQAARLIADMVFRHHGMPIDIVSDRDPRFTSRFWQEVFELFGTQLSMSTAVHPQIDRQTERVNRVLVDALKSYARSFRHWSDCLPMAELAINNTVHASTGHTPFYVNAMRHPRVPSVLGTVPPSLSVGEGHSVYTGRRHSQEQRATNIGRACSEQDLEPNKEFSLIAMDFAQHRQADIRFVQDAIAVPVDRQKLNADNNDSGNTNEFQVGSLVLLATHNLAKHTVSDFGASKLAPR